MTCGLAEEETRFYGPRAGSNQPAAASLGVIYTCIGAPRGLVKPRIKDRPQTACGRSCPWEPTALDVRGDHIDQPTADSP
jgi:hypothetical protein